jgi:EmrB/QacA subfamily drug resistance transporter
MSIQEAIQSTAADHTLDPRRWWILCVVVLAQFMFVVDVFIVNVAIPAIQLDLHASSGQIQLVLAAYQLAYAVLLITGGRLGDIFGRKRLFLFGLGGFTTASALCGFAPTASVLVGARVFQGLAAALMVPQVLAVIQVSFPARERSAAFGIFGFALGMGSIVGLILGGVLISGNVFELGWRMIFLVNLPVGLFGLLAAWPLLHESRAPAALKVDGIGVALISIALFFLTYPLVVGRDLGWPLWSILCLIASLPMLFIFARYERYKAAKDGSPLVNLALFRNGAFALGLVITFVFYAGIVSFLLILTLYLQTGRHFTALAAGLTTTSLGIGFFVTSTAAVKLVPRLGGRVVLLLGMFIMAVGLGGIWLSVSVSGTNLLVIALIVGLFVYGLGEGFVLPTLVNTVLSGIQSAEAGSIAGVFTTMQQISGAIGVALIGIIFFGQLATQTTAESARLQSYTQAFVVSIWYTIALLLMTCVLTFWLPRQVRLRQPELVDLG